MSLKAAILHADENFLIALSNKGLYNRALRELPDSGINISWENKTLTAAFTDGTVLSISDKIQDYRCSCPSRVACKHLLMTILAAGRGQSNEGEDEPESAAPDFLYITAADAKALEKLAGKRILTAALISVKSGQQFDIEEGSTLTVRFHDTGHAVYFLPSGCLDDVRCSCKSADFCIHKTQAVLHVVQRQNEELDDSFFPNTETTEPVFSADPAPIVRDFVRQTLEIGLARLPEDMPGRFLQLATICHGSRLPRLERLCNRVSGQLELLISKNAGFDRNTMLTDLADIYALCLAIETGARDKETIGVFRERYEPQAGLTLYGLGAYPWHTAGGYTGVTLFFYEPQSSRTLRYTLALPDSTKPSPERMIDSGAPWGVPGKLRGLCRAALALSGGKLNDYGQLSSSGDGNARLLGNVNYDDPELDPIRFKNFAELADALWNAREHGRREAVVIVHPSKWEQGSFDKINQTWSCIIKGEDDFPLTLTVRYEPSTKALIDNLAKLFPHGSGNGEGLLVRLWMERGKLAAFPVTLYGQNTVELSFEQERLTRKKKDYYDWGDSP